MPDPRGAVPPPRATPATDRPEICTDPATRAEAEEWFAEGCSGREVADAFGLRLSQASEWAAAYRERNRA